VSIACITLSGSKAPQVENVEDVNLLTFLHITNGQVTTAIKFQIWCLDICATERLAGRCIVDAARSLPAALQTSTGHSAGPDDVNKQQILACYRRP
jgi:hypothetical protein